MLLELKSPCAECPFKNDLSHQRGWLGQRRAISIINSLFNKDESFTCHKTLDLTDRKQQHCAGAMILMEREGRANQYMRIGERTGRYDRNKLNMDGPVFDNREQFIDWHSGSEVITEYQQRQQRAAAAELEKLDESETAQQSPCNKKWLEAKNAQMESVLKELEQKGIVRQSMPLDVNVEKFINAYEPAPQ